MRHSNHCKSIGGETGSRMSRLLAGVFVGLCIASGPGADAQYARVSAGSEVILAADVATTPGLGVRRGDFPSEEVYFTERRAAMVDYLAGEGIDDKAVLAAMGRVPRHLMIAPEAGAIAYEDHPIPIPDEQTISAPYIVGYMTMQLELEPGDRVLEIGTGSGYQTAVLAELAQEVVTIEIIESLARSAAERLKSFGYNNITVLYGDGFFGWPEGGAI